MCFAKSVILNAWLGLPDQPMVSRLVYIIESALNMGLGAALAAPGHGAQPRGQLVDAAGEEVVHLGDHVGVGGVGLDAIHGADPARGNQLLDRDPLLGIAHHEAFDDQLAAARARVARTEHVGRVDDHAIEATVRPVDDVLRLHLVETVEDKLQRLRGITHLGNGRRYGFSTRPRDDLCCQWSFPSYGYTRQRWGLSTLKCRHEW